MKVTEREKGTYIFCGNESCTDSVYLGYHGQLLCSFRTSGVQRDRLTDMTVLKLAAFRRMEVDADKRGGIASINNMMKILSLVRSS